MATFGEANFDTSVPQALYDFIFDLRRQSPDAKFERAVELGCGTGKRCSRRKKNRRLPVDR